MELDTRSLVVASVLIAALMGTVSLVFARMQGSTRLIASWGAAMLFVAAGLAGLALRGTVPDLVSIVLANTAVVTGLVVAIRGLRVFCGVPPKDLLGWGLTALLFILLLLSSEVWDNYTVRTVSINAAVASIAIRAALVLRAHVMPGCELSFKFTENFFWLVGVLTAFRSVAALMFPIDYFLQPSPLNSVTFLFYATFISVSTLGIMWMEIEHLQKDLRRLARFDTLTGLHNRGSFLAEFEREISRVSRSGGQFSLVMFDLDRFKQLNDRHGHPAGDHVLREFADILRASVRRHDVAGRYGGEEFVVLMPDLGKDIAVKVAERIRHAVQAREMEFAGRLLHVTVSGGVASLGEDGADWEALLRAADKALYAAKQGGRNQIVSAPAA